jgi:putative restriction endonuclease
MAGGFDHYAQLIANLRIGRSGDHERPHKPALLLAILSLADAGRLGENRISYDPELFELFRRYFDVVRGEGDQVNMVDPFWRLRTDGLLLHLPKPGLERVVAAQSSAPAVGQIRELTEGSKLPDDLFQMLQNASERERLRDAIVSRYFAAKRAELALLVQQEKRIGEYEKQLEDSGGQPLPVEDAPVREQAFRRVVLRAYDYRCAACGLRVVLDDLVLVDAAHLVPWIVSQDDDPRNGMALCKNHHWAMDRFLIAPAPQPERTWKVSAVLDDRIEGQRDLLDLRNRSILLPREIRFHPRDDALAWRVGRLFTAQ